MAGMMAVSSLAGKKNGWPVGPARLTGWRYCPQGVALGWKNRRLFEAYRGTRLLVWFVNTYHAELLVTLAVARAVRGSSGDLQRFPSPRPSPGGRGGKIEIQEFVIMPVASYLEQMFGLKDQVAVVIGGAGVLGGALCRGLVQAGAHVVVADLTAEGCQARVTELESCGGKRQVQAGRVLSLVYRLGVEKAVCSPSSARRVRQRFPVTSTVDESNCRVAGNTTGIPESANSSPKNARPEPWRVGAR